MRKYIIALLLLYPLSAHAIQKPSAQLSIENGQILRGQFAEIRELQGSSTPFLSSGHFVVAPTRGLIWGMEKPMATSTIITSSVAMQDIGGFAIKLPAKNLRHLFEMVRNAIMGDWTELGRDFLIAFDDNGHAWKATLTPKADTRTPYASITASGSRFVETIVMTKRDGTRDSFSFTNQALSPAALADDEHGLFREVGQP